MKRRFPFSAVCLAFLVLMPAFLWGQETYSIKDTTQAFQWAKMAKDFFFEEAYDSSIVYYGRANALIEKIPDYQKDTALLGIYFYHYNHLARAYMYIGEDSKAKTILDSLLKKERKLLGEKNTSVPITLTFLGTFYREAKEYRKAILQHRTAIEIRTSIFGENALAASYNYNYMANCFMDLEKPDSALFYLDKSLLIKKKNLPPNHLDIALVEHSIGGVYHRIIRDFDKAERYYERAFKIRKEQIPDSDYMAQSYNVLGMLYRDRGELEKAKSNFQAALSIRRRLFGLEHTQTLDSFGLLADVATMEEEHDEAIKYRRKVLDIILNSQKLDHALYYYYLPNLSTTYYMKGDYFNTVKYDKILLEHKLKEIKSGNLNAHQNAQIGLVYQNLATGYAQMEDYESAEKNMIQALRYAQKSQFRSYELRTISDLGVLYEKQGKFDLAEKYLNKFKNAYFDDFESDSTIQAARVALNLGSVYAQKKDFENSLYHFQKAHTIRKRILGADNVETYKILGTIGNSFTTQGRYKEAKTVLEQALSDAKFSLGNISIIQYELLTVYAETLRKLNFLDQSLKYADYALQSINFSKKNIDIYPYKKLALVVLNIKGGTHYNKYQLTDQAQYLIKADSIYKIALQLLTEMRKDKEYNSFSKINEIYNSAFERTIKIRTELVANGDSNYKPVLFSLSESAKSYQLQKVLVESKAESFLDLSNEFVTNEIDLKNNIKYYEKKVYSLKQKDILLTDPSYNKLNTKLFELKDSLSNLKLHLEQNYPDYYRLKYDLNTIEVEEAQQELLAPKQTLLEYFVGDSTIFAFVINQEDYQVVEIEKDFPLEGWVKIFRQANSKKFLNTLPAEYVKVAHQLYKKLVAPVAASLQEEVIIIPDGVLGYVPFEALLVEPVGSEQESNFKTHHYWLKDKQISYCYSATLLREMREKKHKNPATGSLLAFAPFYDGDTTLLADLFRYADDIDKQPLKPLPESGEEVYGIQKMTNGKVYYHEEATEDNFTKEASKYRMLHLATHGKANDKVGDYSFLAFTEQKDSLENELLYVRDLYNLQLNADMVVLSACETGIGELQKGEGIISLARGFTYAGAKSIITSLWSVEDASTKDLMLTFYGHLKKGLSKDAALRQAKLDFIQNSPLNPNTHPFYWSGFIGIGDMGEIEF